jgi:hypothetical protein
MIQFVLDQYLMLLVVTLAMASLLLSVRYRRAKAAKAQCTKQEGDPIATFEREMRLAFDFALLNSGYQGFIQPWVMLRRAIKDLFLSIDDEDESPQMIRVRSLASELGKTYGMLVWAYDRKTPDDKGHLAHFVGTFSPRHWEGMLDAEPKHPMDCYHALPHQSGHAYLVVAKTGILMAQTNEDRIAEGLLWGALADMMLMHYDTFPLEARNALGNLLDCGTEAILAFPGGFDAFEGPLNKMDDLLQTLKGDAREELRDFAAKLIDTYGEKYTDRYGHDLESRIPTFAKIAS